VEVVLVADQPMQVFYKAEEVPAVAVVLMQVRQLQ
jgi:hypothetical protein